MRPAGPWAGPGATRRPRGARPAAGAVLRAVAVLTVLLLAAGPALAQRGRVVPYIDVTPEPRPAAAPWALADPDRSTTIVSSLPVPERYRVCNESNTPAVVTTDARAEGLALPPRSCVDVGARTVTVSQRDPGIPARGTYRKLE